jgi:hypothetical protein
VVVAGVVLLSGRAWADVYTANHNGEGGNDTTVTDPVTGLMWQVLADNQTRTWEGAIGYCQGLSLAGVDDWRLPDAMEFASIINYNPGEPSERFPPVTVFTDGTKFWSSTSIASSATKSGYAWNLDFDNGYSHRDNKTNSYYVLCVRSGPVSWPLGHLVGVQGTVTDSKGLPLNGVAVLTDSGDSTVSDDQGHYALTLNPGDRTITFSKAGEYHKKTKKTKVVAGKSTTLDMSLLGGLGSITVSADIVTEGQLNTSNTINFAVSFADAQIFPVEVHCATEDGTAKAGEDYIAKTGALSFAPGESEKTIAVEVVDDDMMEVDERFQLNCGVVGTNFGATATGTIIDDDVPRIHASNASALEGKSGDSSLLNFFVALNTSAPFPVTVEYATKDGTAKADKDYTTTVGTLTFAAGETQKTVAVPIIGNGYKEADKSLWLVLSTPANGSLARATARGTITNDDQRPLLTVTTPPPFNESAAASQRVVFICKLSSPMASAVTVAYATKNGTATAGADYSPATGTLTFPPGQTSATIKVRILDDFAWEDTETFRLDLGNPPANLIIATPDTTATISSADPFRWIDVKSGVWQGGGVSFTISKGKITSASASIGVYGSCGSNSIGSDNVTVVSQTANGTFSFAGSYSKYFKDGYYDWSWSVNGSIISPTKASITTDAGWWTGYYDGSWNCDSSGGGTAMMGP